ncbi:MAG: hypothetical protein FJ044_02015 [Candidatus Cloacimonetes bacterium]|nr:hypothetical protein [Candidatus Cloacimonadota bacterium]
MKVMERLFSPSIVKVFSGLFTDLSAAWIISLLGARDPWTLTGSLVGVLMCLGVAIYLEESSKI